MSDLRGARSGGEGLQRFLVALASVGVADRDTEEERRRKASLTLVVSRFTALSVIWAVAYQLTGLSLASDLLGGYVALTLLSLVVFATTKDSRWLEIGQYTLLLVVPFAVSYSIGGLERSSGFYLFALLASLLALVVRPRWSWVCFTSFVVLVMVAVLVEPLSLGQRPGVDPGVERAFLALNAAGLAWILFASLAHFTQQSAASLRTLAKLFGLYVPPDIGLVLLADDEWTAIGGRAAEVTAVFADLGGFTSYGEDISPNRLLQLLNRYFALVAPIVRAEGGTLVQYQGDAFLALWNATAPHPRHALAAARAALGIQAAIRGIPDLDPGWPVFRIGINTGPAVVGNVGSDSFRSFTAIGDAINVASRLQQEASAGQVVISSTTYALIRDMAEAEAVGRVALRGRRDEAEVYVLRGMRSD